MVGQFHFLLHHLSLSLQLFLFSVPVSLPALIVLLRSAHREKAFSRPIETRIWLMPLLVLLIFLSVVVVGALGRVDWDQNSFSGPNSRGLVACKILAVSSLSASAYWIFQMNGKRWFAISLTAIQVAMLAGAYIVAGMSLTGRWI